MKSAPASRKFQNQRPFPVGFVATSAKVPRVEFDLGLEKIRSAGFSPLVHSQCFKEHLFFAGKDEERARAFVEFAKDPRFSVVWLARGGFGAARALPLIEKAIRKAGGKASFPRKLLVGYSDATGLQEFVVRNLGWAAVYAPMPGVREFLRVDPSEWETLTHYIRGERAPEPWGKLKFIRQTGKDIVGEVTGGNLTCWTTLIGTPYEPKAAGKIVFLEDVDEALYRLDRMVQHLWLSDSLKGAKAIVLGNFLGCRDRISNVLRKRPKNPAAEIFPKPSDLQPLRKTLDTDRTIRAIFSELGERLGIPVAYGLPVGHGPGHAPLALGGRYRLSRQGAFQLDSWSWLDRAGIQGDAKR